jgi:hypothetical protein
LTFVLHLATASIPEIGLHQLCNTGDIDEVKAILAKGEVDIDSCGGILATPGLCWASRAGYKDIVELLLENGADVSKCGTDGKTALHYAVPPRPPLPPPPHSQPSPSPTFTAYSITTTFLSLVQQIQSTNEPVARCLISKSCDINALDVEGKDHTFHCSTIPCLFICHASTTQGNSIVAIACSRGVVRKGLGVLHGGGGGGSHIL